ncbi:molybdenum ABC transporter substrate-binding protein [Paenibacillus yonginensis]|uniref:Molybdenum ABC transporter substrate-binding protein n=1 Tax=Paenibacillus yonginensis TaxID=1462996 RepID=A0A1B1MW16_9BACL|nr:molybdate ABC transporter substrate-binding protein [Paenibacillus yonginensis]ANS73368.1 molybdenum ABC transporter substrate-binding protein [Paenibacillus yonginensis]
MINKIKFSMVLLFVVMIIAVLSGCGNGGKKENVAPTAASTDSAAVPNAGTPAKAGSEEPQSDVELTISAAASLTDALKEISQSFEAQHPHIHVNFNFGASGMLQQQIEQGAPADLFLSAASKNMQALLDKQLIDSSQEVNLLNNDLVVVTPLDKGDMVQTLDDLKKPEVKTVAIGIPESVPAGNYAQEALQAAGLWDSLQSKTVQGKDVRQVLQYVETGNADAGFVYKTDALTSDQVKVAFSVDSSLYKAIEYPIGIVKATKHSREAEAFYQYLQTKEALDVFVKYGFTIPQK